LNKQGPRSSVISLGKESAFFEFFLAIAVTFSLSAIGCGVSTRATSALKNSGQSSSGSSSWGSSGTSGSGSSGAGSSTGSGSSGTGSGTGSSGSGGSTTTSNASGVYGAAINADALNNITIGPHVASYRFLSTHTGKVDAAHFFLIVHGPHAGYNSGTGGTLKVQLETDDGSTAHDPSGNVLATYSIPQPQDPFPVIKFSPAPTLQAGTLYHLVFSNSDANPTGNFVSIDDLYMQRPLNPMQPGSSNENMATLLKEGSSWSVYDFNTPIFELDFTDGASMGQGYTEVWVGAPESISGSAAVRETFTVTGGDRSATQVSVRVARASGSGDLKVRLEQSDGNVVEQGTIPASAVPLSSSPQYVWATYKLSAMRTLLNGVTYHLDLEAPSGTTYRAYPIRKGSAQAFQSSTFFRDGYAEFQNSGAWVGWTQWGVANRTDGDLQFYFKVIE
jgi:hypothetical protein